MSKRIVLKSLLAVAMVGFVLSFSSCKKKEDPSPTNPTSSSVSPPTNLSVTDVAGTSVRLIWAGTADSYEIQFPNQQTTNNYLISTTNTSLVTDLTENTAYTWKVRAKKGNNYSKWVNGPSFTTTETLPIVGTWEYKKIEVKDVTCNDPTTEFGIKMGFQQYAGESIDGYLSGTYEFAQDGKLMYQTGIGNGEASYTVNGSKLTIADFDFVSGTFDFFISGKKMYWDVDGFAMADQVGISDLLIEMGVTKITLRITFAKQ